MKHPTQPKKSLEKKQFKALMVLLSLMIFIIVAVILLVNWNAVVETFNRGNYNLPDTGHDYTLVEIDDCDTKTVVEPMSVSNISKNGNYPYYAYADEYGRIIRVEAKELHSKAEDNGRTGRLCERIFPLSSNREGITSIGFVSGDNRGHLIADQFDGVSNAYNISAQDEVTNQKVYKEIEDIMAQAIRNQKTVHSLHIEIEYEDISIRRPYQFKVTFFVDTQPYGFLLSNDGNASIKLHYSE